MHIIPQRKIVGCVQGKQLVRLGTLSFYLYLPLNSPLDIDTIIGQLNLNPSIHVQSTAANQQRFNILQTLTSLLLHLCCSISVSLHIQILLHQDRTRDSARSQDVRKTPSRLPCGIPPHGYRHLRAWPGWHWPWLGKCCWELAPTREAQWSQVHSASCSRNPHHCGELTFEEPFQDPTNTFRTWEWECLDGLTL